MFSTANDFTDWLHQQMMQLRQSLDMETVILSSIEQGNYVIVAVDSEMEGVFEVGQQFPLEDTYCRAVYESQKTVLYNHVATIESLLQHPVYQAVKLESYIASPIKDDKGNVIGTLNFTSLLPRKPAFSEEQQQAVFQLADEISNNYPHYLSLANGLV